MDKILLILFVVCISSGAIAHDDDDHSVTTIVPDVQTQFAETHSSKYEVVLNYKNPQPGEELMLRIFISEYYSNKPVSGAAVILDIAGAEIIEQPVLVENGIYESKVIFSDIEKFDILISIKENGIDDLLLINDFVLTQLNSEHTHDSSLIVRIFTNPIFLVILILLLIAVTAAVFYKLGRIKKS